MKATTILLGLSLVANVNQAMPNYQNVAWELSMNNAETIGSAYENVWLNSEMPIMIPNAEVCQRLYASAMAVCYGLAWNPPAFAVCAAAASASFAACLAAS